MTTAVSVWAGETWEPDGSEDFESLPGDIKIVSAVSTMEGASKHVGEFWHSDRGGARSFSDTLDVVPLMVRTNRTFFGAGNNTPLCRSNDGRTIAPGQPLWALESVVVRDGTPPVDVPSEPRGCETCPFSRWEGNTDPPLCGEAKVLLMMRQDDDSLARFRFSGTGIKPLSKFIRQEVVNARRPLYSWRLSITTTEVQRGGKKWFEPKFVGTDLSLDEAHAYRDLVAAQRIRFETPVDEDADFETRQAGAPSTADSVGHDFSVFWQLMDGLNLGKKEIREDVVSILAPGSISDLEPYEYAVLADDILSAAGQDTLAGLTAAQRRQVVLVVRAERLKRTEAGTQAALA